MKGIVSIDAEATRRHLGLFLFIGSFFLFFSFSLLLCSYFVVDFHFLCRQDGSQKHYAEFRHRILKRPHGESYNNSPKFASFRELKFSSAIGSSVPKVQPQRKQKGKKVAKDKDVMQVDANTSSTSMGMSELNALAKDFPYQEFMDRLLMTLATLEQFLGDKDDLMEKL